MIGVSNNLMYQ